MEQFRRAHFVGADTLDVYDYPGYLLMQGQIACKGRIVITVRKLIGYVSGRDDVDPLVQTLSYSYAVSLRGRGQIFRYDNQHSAWRYPGHQDEHHKHEFDWMTGNELDGSPIWVGADKWPSLGQVIEETREWHSEHYSELGETAEEFVSDLQKEIRT